MFSFLPGRFLFVVISVFLVLNIVLWYFLTLSLPVNVEITDIKNNSAVIVWNSIKKENSTVYYSTSPWLLRLLPLAFPLVKSSRQTDKTVNHKVTLTGLSVNKNYYFTIAQNLHFYLIGQKFLTQQAEPAALTVSGMVIDNSGKPVARALVVNKNRNNKALSVLTNDKGEFKLDVFPTESLVFLTARNGARKEKTVFVQMEIIKQSVLITLP